jgi:hypothetical protein
LAGKVTVYMFECLFLELNKSLHYRLRGCSNWGPHMKPTKPTLYRLWMTWLVHFIRTGISVPGVSLRSGADADGVVTSNEKNGMHMMQDKVVSSEFDDRKPK